jgi:hypothetical protein
MQQLFKTDLKRNAGFGLRRTNLKIQCGSQCVTAFCILSSYLVCDVSLVLFQVQEDMGHQHL